MMSGDLYLDFVVAARNARNIWHGSDRMNHVTATYHDRDQF